MVCFQSVKKEKREITRNWKSSLPIVFSCYTFLQFFEKSLIGCVSSSKPLWKILYKLRLMLFRRCISVFLTAVSWESCKIQGRGYHEAICARIFTVLYKPCSKVYCRFPITNQLSAKLIPCGNGTKLGVGLNVMQSLLRKLR